MSASFNPLQVACHRIPLSFIFRDRVQSPRSRRPQAARTGDDLPMSEHPVFARFYDRLTARMERGVLGEMRREALADAAGRTLELGAGTGHNLPYYTDAVTELVLTEPDPHMAVQLRDRLAEEGARA